MKNDHHTAQNAEASILRYPFGLDFQAILSLIGDGVVSVDIEGRIILFNRAAESIFGHTSVEVLGGSIDALIPMRFRDQHKQDVDRFSSSETQARRAMGFGREVLGLHKDGSELPVEATLSRQVIDGRHVLTAVIRDISDRRVVEQQRLIVANEVAHRLRNTMAVVNSIVTLTARSALSVDEFKEALLGRFGAISRTNDSLIRESWIDADLHKLLESELAPFRDKNDNINLNGCNFQIDGQTAVSLALVFHELATNAAKYGALSNASGCLDVNWHVSLDTKRQLEITWKESDGPAVAVPTRQGFGSELISRSLHARGGKVDTTYAPDGFWCSIHLPLA